LCSSDQQEFKSVNAIEETLVVRHKKSAEEGNQSGGKDYLGNSYQNFNLMSCTRDLISETTSLIFNAPVMSSAKANGQKGCKKTSSNLTVSQLHGLVLNGNDSEELNLEANSLAGNSVMNFNQELSTEEHALFNNAIITPNAGLKGQVGGVVGKSQELQKLAMPLNTPVKRSKSREGSVDEDVKKNLDAPGMSEAKSFLSFPNAKIKSTITSLGIGCSSNIDIDVGIDKIKEIEYMRSLEGSNVGTTKEVQNSIDDELHSDIDTDLGLDHNAIRYLTGDIAESSVGNDGSPMIDFKPTPKTKKTCSNRQHKVKNKSKNKRCHSK
jgi:hypothetical protein